MRPVVDLDLGRRRYDHHHDRDREDEQADDTGERGCPGALRANEGCHFRYPLPHALQVRAIPLTYNVSLESERYEIVTGRTFHRSFLSVGEGWLGRVEA